MLFESLKRSDVRTFLQQLITQDRYKKIAPPESLKNNYYLEDKYAFFLAIDALSKFEQIIDDDDLVDEYIEQLERIFKKFNHYNEIKKGIYSLVGKIVGAKLNITNPHLPSNREKILRYIYEKYIVNGYFYFGFSSNYINELSFVGIRKDGFLLDPKLVKINQIFRKTSDLNLFSDNSFNISITDNIIIAFYYALLSPDYLSRLVTSPYLKDDKYDKECFYTKDIVKIKENLLQLSNDRKLNAEDKNFVINTFIDVYSNDNVNELIPCIATIKRSSIGKNALKDIEEIIKNKEDSLITSISLILESRYHSYEITNDILPFAIEITEIPSYNEFILGKNSFAIVNKKVNLNEDELKIDEESITRNKEVNSYGAVSIAIIGAVLIVVGIIITIILQINK